MRYLFETQLNMDKGKGAILRQRQATAQKQRNRRSRKVMKIPPRQLLNLLPVEQMEALAESVGVDYQVKHLFAPLLVQLFILAILRQKDTSQASLKDLYNSKKFQFFSGKGGHQTAKSSLSDRLGTIKCEYFEQLYEQYLAALKQKFGKQLGKQFGYLTRFDSTMLALSASLTQIGMGVGAKPKKGEGKVQIKITLGLQGLLPSVVKVSHEQKMLSEENALKAAIESQLAEKEGIITFDMGLKKRKTLQEFDQDGRFFVTRLKEPRFEFCRTHKQIQGRKHGKLCFLSDQIVRLYQSGASDEALLDHEFRLIIARCEQGPNAGKTFYFLTNILDLTAFEIADIYLRRWDIEVFFRFLKQEVGLTNLLATNENGIKAVIYLRILVGTMIWAFIHLNNRNDYKAAKRTFEEEVDWEIDLLVARLIGNKNPEQAKLYLIDFQGILIPKST